MQRCKDAKEQSEMQRNELRLIYLVPWRGNFNAGLQKSQASKGFILQGLL